VKAKEMADMVLREAVLGELSDTPSGSYMEGRGTTTQEARG